MDDNAPVSGGVGIIIPPVDIRGIIDTTAQFVAKMGPEFESRVLQEQNTPKFAFLLKKNPFRAYYEFKVKEFSAGNAPTETKVQKPDELVKAELELQKKKDKKENKLKMLTNQAEDDKDIPPPPPDQFTVNHPAVTPLDADVICVVAQFVARNGQKFLVGVTQRESRNPQFDFLKPTHPLFGYFTSLVDAYTKVLLPSKEDLVELRKYNSAKGFHYILEKAMRRFQYDDKQNKIKKADEARAEAEREQMAMIDWHDFIVVETIDFTKEDDEIPLAAPMDTSKGALASVVEALDIETVMPATIEDEEPMDMEMEVEAPEIPTEAPKEEAKEEEEMEMDEEDKPAAKGEDDGTIPLPTDVDLNAPVKIRSNYVRQPKRSGAQDQQFQKCPITGQFLPVDEINEHVRIAMLNPQWKKEQDIQASKRKQENLFEEDVEANLAAFVAKRPDIFGTVDEEIQVAAEAGAEQSAREAGADAGPAAAVYNPEAVKPLPPAPPTSALTSPGMGINPALTAAMFHAIRPPVGAPPAPPHAFPPTALIPPPPPGLGAPDDDDDDDEQAAKRQKIETFLQSEYQWAQSHPRPVALTIKISPDFGMNKPDVTLQIEVTKPISAFKSMLETITHIPSSRMALRDQKTTLIMRQQHSLAFYNMQDGSIIEIAPKERGGRRK
eukprot:GEMP01026375.1.p1 GENE.GEMP01026375.1~~GEMP01026375.1.p1  ORF type:complete len:666 (+),score=175.78 GEMP01026375.1:267-2264(+)